MSKVDKNLCLRLGENETLTQPTRGQVLGSCDLWFYRVVFRRLLEIKILANVIKYITDTKSPESDGGLALHHYSPPLTLCMS